MWLFSFLFRCLHLCFSICICIIAFANCLTPSDHCIFKMIQHSNGHIFEIPISPLVSTLSYLKKLVEDFFFRDVDKLCSVLPTCFKVRNFRLAYFPQQPVQNKSVKTEEKTGVITKCSDTRNRANVPLCLKMNLFSCFWNSLLQSGTKRPFWKSLFVFI